MKKLLFFILLSYSLKVCAGETDSLIQLLSHHRAEDTAKVNRYLDIAYQMVYEEQSDSMAAIWIQKALDMSNTLGYTWGTGKSYYLTGKRYIRWVNYPKAMRNFIEASEFFEKGGFIKDFALAQMQLGIIYYAQKNYKEAIPDFDNAAQKLFAQNDLLNAATCEYLSGLSYLEINEYEKSEQLLKNAMKITDSLQTGQRSMECRMGLANLYLKKNELKTARFYFDTCLAYFEIDTAEEALVMCLTGYGKLELKEGNLVKAEKNFIKAYTLAKKLNSFRTVIICTEPLPGFYIMKKDYEKALRYQTEYNTAKDSLYTLDNARLIATLQNNITVDKQKSEILLLNEQVESDRIIRIGLIAIAILFVALSWNWYHKNRIKKKANKQLSDANTDLAKAMNNLRGAQEQLLASEKMASLGALTAGIAHEIKNPLNFVNNFSELTHEMVEELIKSNTPAEKIELSKNIKQNLEKITHHGKRANQIVQSMLLHSRGNTGEKQLADINKMCDEYTQLAYHGILVTFPGLKCEILKPFDPAVPKIKLNQQDFSRVLLNLLNNAFYAVKDKHNAKVEIKTEYEKNKIVISVRDNGPGIPENIRKKIFEPFFTTKPTGEGTGLGLSISYDIIKSHGGELLVDSKEGAYTEFKIVMPV